MSRRRAALVVPLVVAVSLVLGGCVQNTSTGKPHAVPTPNPSSTAVVPVYDANGTAKQNLAYFRLVGHSLLDNNSKASAQGKTIVDWFVAHGFQKTAMQVTPDKTSIGLDAWNIEFSVEMNKTCLIGQAGNTGFQSFAAPLLATGKCLIGTTRTINW
jgi:hypothetical protein